MFGRKEKKLGGRLADLAIEMAGHQEVLKAMGTWQFNQIEVNRFVFALSIANISLNTFYVNLSYDFDGAKAKKILDPMLDAYSKELASSPERIKIGDFIVDQDELRWLKSNYEVAPETETNYFTLLDMVYPHRSTEYWDKLHVGFKKYSEAGSDIGPLLPLAQSLSNHFHGKREVIANYRPDIFELNMILSNIFKTIVDFVGNAKL